MSLAPLLLAVGALTALAVVLAVLLLVAERFFNDYGECGVRVNGGERTLRVPGGNSLLSTLAERKLFLPSGCGGRGSCGVCRCRVTAGGGPVLPTETPFLNEADLAAGLRLACQVKVKTDLEIEVPAELLSVRELTVSAERIEELTHDIRGVRFRLPEGEEIRFRAGQYVNLVAPPYGGVKTPTVRAYSIASAPSQTKAVELYIRRVPSGLCTTWVFDHLREGMPAKLIGPYGDFWLRESDREILFIAGGSGLAPIRSLVLDMVERGISHRKATFYFGAVRQRDLYCLDEFRRLEADHPWFRFVPALSGDETGHEWRRGLITRVVAEHAARFDRHEAYLCGSPGMIDACVKTLTGQGLPADLVFYDKFS